MYKLFCWHPRMVPYWFLLPIPFTQFSTSSAQLTFLGSSSDDLTVLLNASPWFLSFLKYSPNSSLGLRGFLLSLWVFLLPIIIFSLANYISRTLNILQFTKVVYFLTVVSLYTHGYSFCSTWWTEEEHRARAKISL